MKLPTWSEILQSQPQSLSAHPWEDASLTSSQCTSGRLLCIAAPLDGSSNWTPCAAISKAQNHLPPECHKMQSEISPHCQPLSIQKSSAGADETVDDFEWLDLGSRSPQSMASSELPWALAHSYRGQDTATMQTCLTNPWNQTALLTLYSKTSSLARVLLESTWCPW